ncbi:class I SAM-dependent methyltransferase [Sciscionella sediminilitoris]|uniref:class I SAM-dependent methyltransferase n=1 Tax=Sciscionella sediminilitoris TaxID=1445613 RepID=UPI0004DF37B6|nr:class I SAM-dependent methyltransferase [Sciscionella sp. SE31]
MSFNDYDVLAEDYARHNERNAYNAYYERPATLELAGDVRGLRVLDAGCGSGAHAEALLSGGASVTGLDSSAGILALARERLGARATLLHANLAEPLPLPDNGFDLVIAPLVLHYLRDWEPTLREFRRVLGNGGRLVFSTHHPTMDFAESGGEDYFATYAFTEDWPAGDRTVTMRFWHRPLTAMTEALRASGFAIERLTEPAPVPECRELFPEDYRTISTKPRFLFFDARAVRSGD